MEILDTFALELPCQTCGGTYRLPLKNIALSQQVMHDGCPVHDERECPPVHNAPLLGPEVLAELKSVWSKLESQARGAGGRLVLESEPETPLPG